MSGLLPASNSKLSDGGFAHVRKFLTHLSHLCEKYDITILGIVHSPKAKEDAQYLRPRDRVMGSSAWAAYTETIILIEPVHADAPGCRKMTVLPRNAPEETHDLQFNGQGRLVYTADDLDEVFIRLFLDKFPHPREFSTEQFTTALIGKMSQATITRWLKNLHLRDGVIRRVRHGIYTCTMPA